MENLIFCTVVLLTFVPDALSIATPGVPNSNYPKFIDIKGLQLFLLYIIAFISWFIELISFMR